MYVVYISSINEKELPSPATQREDWIEWLNPIAIGVKGKNESFVNFVHYRIWNQY